MTMSASSTELGLRERKKRRTRRALRDAAVRLADERGYDAVTVEDIAQAVEVSARTFFNYFASKEDAITGIDDEEIREVAAALAARPADESPVAALRAVMIGRSMETAVNHEAALAKMRVVRANPSLVGAFHAAWGRYEAALVDVVAWRCGLDPEVDTYPSVVVAAALAVSRAINLRWRDSPDGTPLPIMIAAALDNLAAGLTPPTASASRPRKALSS
jgi:AcrR family transcriptional regulator